MDRHAGVISDTHGLLRPEVFEVFKNVDLIFHAGDIGSSDVLKKLKTLAPVVAVRGNNDAGDWASEIPETTITQIGPISIYMLHDLKELDRSAHGADFQVVVSGHSHRPSIERRDGILFVNPGSAGPRRFKLPVSAARLTIHESTVSADLIELSNSTDRPNGLKKA